MPITLSTPLLRNIARLVAFTTGIAIPLRASGVASEQTALALALVGALILLATQDTVRTALKAALTSPAGKLIALAFGAWLITVPFSVAPLGSLHIGGRSAAFLCASAVIWAALHTNEDAQNIVWKTLIIAALGIALLAVLSLNGVPGIISALKFEALTRERPEMTFKAYAAAALCLIPATAWAGRKLGGHWRWWGYAFAPLALIIMLQTSNRAALAGFIAMAFTGVVLLAVTKRKHAKALLATVTAGAVGIVAWIATREISLYDRLAQNQGHELQTQMYLPYWLLDPHRQNIWKFAFERFLEHPLVGNGIDQLNRLPGAKMPVPGLESVAAFVPSHPHNWALEILAETGLVGFLPVLFALGFIAWRLMRSYLSNDGEEELALLALMAGFWASALFNFSIWAVWWQLTFSVLFAIIAASRHPRV